MNRKATLLTTLAFGLTGAPAFAHVGRATDGLTAGLVHPFLGWDHLLAMVAVGILAVRAQQPVRWSLPLLFVSNLALGALAGIFGGAVAGAEGGIAAGLVLIGLLLVWGRQMASGPLYALIAATAVFHGVAHGAEVSGPWGAYLAGMLAGTLALHLGGLTLGRLGAQPGSRLGRIYGGATLAAGLVVLMDLI